MLCHRDYHSRNLMLHHDRLYIIDFQDARMGPDTYDLVSLLRDSYVDLPERTVDELHRLLPRAQGSDRHRSASSAQRFDLMALQRNLKALGTFGYQTTARRNPVYIQYIPRTLRYVRDNLEHLPRFARLRELLRRARRGVPVDRPAAQGSRLRHDLRRAIDDLPERLSREALSPEPAAPWYNSGFTQARTGCSMRFGISTHLYHDRRLERDHLAQIAGYGFEAIELFATRSHFDYRTTRRSPSSAQWLGETGLTLNSVHAPITDVLRRAGDRGRRTRTRSPRTTGARRPCAKPRRRSASRGTIPFDVLVVHLGTPADMKQRGRQPPRRGRCEASRRSAGSPSRSASGSRSR